MAMTSTEVSAILVPVGELVLILPSVMVAEILSGRDTKVTPPSDAPNWILGTIDWRGCTVPLLGFDTVCELPTASNQNTASTDKILVLKNPSGGETQPYVALAISSYPQVIAIKPGSISTAPEPPNKSSMVSQYVMYNNRITVIPNFEKLNSELTDSCTQLSA